MGLALKVINEGLEISIDTEKREQWLDTIDAAIQTGTLAAGSAGKLAGKLGFGAQFVFDRCGRAMLRPVYRQQYAPLRSGRVSTLLASSLRWWRQLLISEPVRVVGAYSSQREVVHMFTDAAGEGGLCALLHARRRWYGCHMTTPRDVYSMLCRRKDEQILALEMLAVLIAIDTFLDLIADCAVVFHIDNAGVVGILRCGAARAPDHNILSFSFWAQVAQQHIAAWLEWVPSGLNIADGPTRHDYSIYETLRATVVDARLDRSLLVLRQYADDIRF